jgi:hypothetical protein
MQSMEITEKAKQMAIIIAIVCGLAMIGIAIFTENRFRSQLPPVPSLEAGPGQNADTIKANIDNYKALSAAIKDNSSTLYELLVTNFLNGIFNALLVAIIAYVFGRPLLYALGGLLHRQK